VGSAFLPTIIGSKRWANEKAVCPPYTAGQCPVDNNGNKWPWKGQQPQVGDKGGYKNPNGPESMHPDLDHGGDIGPHWDFNDRNGPGYRIGPDGTIWPK
jgi:hypothetical protein